MTIQICLDDGLVPIALWEQYNGAIPTKGSCISVNDKHGVCSTSYRIVEVIYHQHYVELRVSE